MYLDVNWKDGTVTHIPLSQSHTIQVIADGKVQDSFSFDGVGSLTLNLDGAPAATDPNPGVPVGAAEGATVTPDEQAAQDAADAAARQAAADAEAQANADQAAAEQAALDQAATSTNDASATVTLTDVSAPEGSQVTPEPETTSDPHADAVDAAATTVAAAQEVAASDTPAADKQVQIQTALADIETELAQFPDSQPLLDAKAQLEALAGEITEA